MFKMHVLPEPNSSAGFLELKCEFSSACFVKLTFYDSEKKKKSFRCIYSTAVVLRSWKLEYSLAVSSL